MDTRKALRIVAVAEALSWLALIVATIVKYADSAPLGVKILGPIHGVLFLAYVALAFEVRRRIAWDNRPTRSCPEAASSLPGEAICARPRAYRWPPSLTYRAGHKAAVRAVDHRSSARGLREATGRDRHRSGSVLSGPDVVGPAT